MSDPAYAFNDEYKLCVNCGKVARIEDITYLGDLLECRNDYEGEFYSACTFDWMTNKEVEDYKKAKEVYHVFNPKVQKEYEQG